MIVNSSETTERTSINIPFRIRVGVTGHRVLKEPEKIAVTLREIINSRIHELFVPDISRDKSITPITCTIVTALAEGADRLVANELLRIPGSDVEVILPLAKKDYLRDFKSAASKKEFEELYRRSGRHTVMKPDSPAATVETRSRAEARRKAYEDAGRYIVDHCDMLIAIWDGSPPHGKGGTAEIVAYARKSRCPLIIVSSENPESFNLEKGTGMNGQALVRLETLNRFSVEGAGQEAYVSNVYESLFNTPEGERIDAQTKSNIRQKLLPYYVRSSLLAKSNQKSYLAAALLVYVLSPLAVASVALAMLIHSISVPAFIAEFLILLIIFVVIFLTDRKQAHKRWIEGRFLVERIRSAMFLIACGVKPSPITIPRHMKLALSSIDWVMRAFGEIEKGIGELQECRKEDLGLYVDFIRKEYIQDQIAFHRAKSAKTGKTSHRLENIGKLVFFIAIGVAAIHLISTSLNLSDPTSWLENSILFLAIVLPGAGAAIGGIRTHREYSRLEKRSSDMAAALGELDRQFAGITTIDEFKDLMSETEQLLLQETQEWLALMKYVKVEPI